MDIGGKIKQLRLEAGLSQRQLCGDVITRNMLSQIENGSARPSMDTLAFLAARLGKSVSYFLEEDAVTSPNLQAMQQARAAFSAGDYEETLWYLKNFKVPDETFGWEYDLLRALATVRQAEKALAEKRSPYARQLLAQIDIQSPYVSLVQEKRQLLLSQAGGESELPRVDSILLEKAKRALAGEDPTAAAAYLQAVDQRDALWQYTMGQAYAAMGEYAQATELLTCAEETYPQQVIPLLEECYSAMGDYKRAYEYACKQKK